MFFYHIWGVRELRSWIRWSPIFSVCFMLILTQHRNFGLTFISEIRIEQFQSLTCFFTISKGFVSSEAEFLGVRFMCLFTTHLCLKSKFGPKSKLGHHNWTIQKLKLVFYHFKGVRELRSWIHWSPIFRVCFLLILTQHRNLGLTPISDIRIVRFQSLTCFFTISEGFVSSEVEFIEVRFLVSVSLVRFLVSVSLVLPFFRKKRRIRTKSKSHLGPTS